MRCFIPAMFAIILGLTSPLSAGVAIGQTDDFEDGTTEGWQINLAGFGFPPAEALPSNQTTGGPGGANDNYLKLVSLGGTGAGSRLAVINATSSWTGDYLASGITAIQMQANNLGSNDLSLRLMFADSVGGVPTNLAYSSTAITVPSGSGWMLISFPVTVADLTAGLGNVTSALSGVTDLRLYHSPTSNYPNPGSPIPAIAASLGVDNITAIPEPSALLLLPLLPLMRRRTRTFQ